jgi:hypothetical protein
MRAELRFGAGPFRSGTHFAIRRIAGGVLPFVMLLCVSCRTFTPLPPADLSAPGWTVLQGQAAWKPPNQHLDLAGDLLLATNINGDCFVQFSKTPFPLVMARVSGDQWQIQFGVDQNSWHGHGTPPSRFGWFILPRALRGEPPGGGWQFEGDASSWDFYNSHTSETLEGRFFK